MQFEKLPTKIAARTLQEKMELVNFGTIKKVTIYNEAKVVRVELENFTSLTAAFVWFDIYKLIWVIL